MDSRVTCFDFFMGGGGAEPVGDSAATQHSGAGSQNSVLPKQ